MFKVIFAMVGCIAVCAAANAAPPASQDKKFTVLPFVIDPQSFPGAPTRADQAQELQHLSVEATKQAISSCRAHKIADVEDVTHNDQGTSGPTITGIIHMPISLPSNVIGWNAAHQPGNFAAATVTVTDSSGKVVFVKDVAVAWKAAWWSRIGKFASNYPLDSVLDDFARRAADKAVRVIGHDVVAAAR